MNASERKDLKVKEKAQVEPSVERTTSGPVFTPAVDILETDKDITVLADMPGVKSDDVSIDLRDNILSLIGIVGKPEADKEADVIREYHTGTYARQFSLSNEIDQGKIDAKLEDGVLQLLLPKVEAATPRKIAVRAG